MLRTHRSGISYTPVKEPGRAILSLWRASKGKGTEGTRHFPGVLYPGSSYFPFAIPTQYFEVRALPNKRMLDAEFPIPAAVGSRSLQGGCTCLTVSHCGGSFIPHSAFTQKIINPYSANVLTGCLSSWELLYRVCDKDLLHPGSSRTVPLFHMDFWAVKNCKGPAAGHHSIAATDLAGSALHFEACLRTALNSWC